jgi:protocatechuate 3,4-dioxygenase beta subunit
MRRIDRDLSRRHALQIGGLALSAWCVPGVFAQSLVQTPAQTEGPFYPDHLPLDRDNDLVIVSDGVTPAIGDITQLSGRVLSGAGSPLRGVTVEIWQVDGRGVYLHSGSGNTGQGRDKHFQGFGRFETGSTGEYRFRTIKPVAYPGRTPHIHFKVKRGDRELLVTQCYIKGEPQNARDGVLSRIADPRARESVIVDFAPVPGSPGMLAANFDIVLGLTPSE